MVANKAIVEMSKQIQEEKRKGTLSVARLQKYIDKYGKLDGVR